MGKTRLQMRADLRLDLKDSGALWSDPELNRCVEIAVSDLSRFLPRERFYEEVLDFTVTGEVVTMPTDTDTDAVVAAEDLNAVDDGSAVGVDGQPDVPRPLTVTLNDANNSVTGMTVSVYGTGEDELAVSETFQWLRGDSKTIPGKMYFKNVYMVYVDQIDGAGPGDTLDIGYGAYTDVWVALAYKPIKWGSEASATDVDGNAVVRDTDFFIDYVNGRIKVVSGGGIIAGDTVTISYTKNQTHIDLSVLADFIRVHRVEYPVGDIPQNFCQVEVFGKMMAITGQGEYSEQTSLIDKKQVRIQYDAAHTSPNDFAPGTIPAFLENTVLKAAAAYALLVMALKGEHQAATDLASALTYIGDANTEQANMTASLANAKTYLVDNADEDAVGILKDITDNVVELRDKVNTALDAANGAADNMDSYVGLANTAKEGYMGSTANYVDGATEPDILAYLTTGDALLNKITEGGENEKTAETYALYARAVRESLVATLEQNRLIYVQQATLYTNNAMAYVQEAAQRLANLRTHIEESQGYVAVSVVFVREAELRIAKMNVLLAQASRSIEAAGGDLVLADRFRTEAIERRDEVWTIWRDRKEYIGDFASSSMNQPREYK